MNEAPTEQQVPKVIQSERLNFFGNASEYFGIWFVNGVLNMMTLGLYGPWAKVRTLRYFYGNTEIAGGSFDFTADPKKMLLSRIIALALLVLFYALDVIQTKEAIIAYIGLMLVSVLVMPVILVFVASFRLRHSVWSGINFSFNKDFKAAYKIYLVPVFLLTLCLASFAIPFNSESVEDYLGWDRHDRIAQEELDEGDYEDEVPESELESDLVETSPEAVVEGEWDVESESANDAQEAESQGDDTWSDEDDLEAWEDEEWSDDEESELDYINPYLFIPAGLLALLFIAGIPYFDYLHLRFVGRNVRFGKAAFTFHTPLSDFYRIYGYWLLSTLGFIALFAAMVTLNNGTVFFLAGVAWLLYFAMTKAYFKSRRLNAVLGGLQFDDDRYQIVSRIPFMKLCVLLIVNTIVVILTLGFMRPWAQIRVARFLLAYIAVESEHSFDQFLGRQTEEDNALGEEIADAFDVDLGF